MEIQWSLVIFTVLTGGAGWMAACIALDEFQKKASKSSFKASVVAIAVALVGGIASVTHLSHPENIMGVFGHPTSGIFTEAMFVGLLIVALLVFALLKKREASEGACKAVGVIAGVLGIILSCVAGASYMMESVPAWNTPLLPAGYLGTAIPLGVALFMLVAKMSDPESDLTVYAKCLAIGGIVAAILALAFSLPSGATDGSALGCVAVAIVLAGVAPAVLGFMMSKDAAKCTTGMIGAALACALIGAACFRIAMWLVATPVANLFLGSL